MSEPVSSWLLAGLLARLLAILPNKLLYTVTRTSIIAFWRGLPLRSFLNVALARVFLNTFWPYELQYMLPGTSETIQAWQKQKRSNDQPSVMDLPNGGGVLHWLDGKPHPDRKDTKVLLFFHGGGYIVPIGAAHLKWCKQHSVIAHASGVQLHVAVLAYDLCPGVKHPRQLQQAAMALKGILELGVSPQNIVVGGDSAGGNLTFALLGHLMHPHPEVIKVKLHSPLGGAFGISPWLTMNMSTSSFHDNENIDMLSSSTVHASARYFLPEDLPRGDSWSAALDASPKWWSDWKTVASRVYLNTGRHEVFRDHVVEFAQKLAHGSANGSTITLDVGEMEAHDHVLVEFMLGEQGGRAFWSLMIWMLDTLKH